MQIIKTHEGTIHQTVKIKGIEGDMGEKNTLSLFQEADGDVVLTMENELGYVEMGIQFCSSNGGGHRPVIAKKLRELITELQK